ncbi:MAG: sodium:proton antiporter [Planctomycetes bacterium]|nr:sodium:proton antiporter [Planctomycetota bacterium]
MHSVHPLWPLGSLPFVLLLLAIAVLPLIPRAAHWWHANSNKLIVAAACGVATLLFIAGTDSVGAAWHALEHTLLAEYVPFIILLGSLYVVAGGIVIRGDLAATPATNTSILLVGTLLASIMGTTGASVLLIRLLLATNQQRTRVVHTVVFFIFLVSNIGGLLLPIGDPPLFLGYLRGVPFFWTLHMWKPFLFVSGSVLAIYWVVDSWMFRREPAAARAAESVTRRRVHLSGSMNLLWLVGILAAVIVLIPGRALLGTSWTVPNFAREAVMVACAVLSLVTTRAELRRVNSFTWGPILEVAVLFIGIFVAMQVPLGVLQQRGGELGLSSPNGYFWASGILSSFLDNAPTYLVFLTTAITQPVPSGSVSIVLVDGSVVAEPLLAAVSLGAVFMGANTYIGNGPNFMVKAIAEERGVRMPTFFGYMAWAAAILIPVFIATSLLFLR